MGIRIFRNMQEYVKHITEREQTIAPTFVASIFLSSHLFSKTALLRFFEKDLGSKQSAVSVVNDLWYRRKRIHSNMGKVAYREIYESGMFEEFCERGIVHRQSPNFRMTPKEITAVLQNMLTFIHKNPLYEIAFCREVLPFAFIVKKGIELTIDVTNNFGYQRIQGLLIEDEHIVKQFEEEFWRIWNEGSTLSNKEQVVSFLESKLALVADSSRFLISSKPIGDNI